MSKKFILASASPRRKELLTQAGVKFEIKIPDIDETPLPHENAKKMVRRLSELKSKEVWRNFLSEKDSAVILAADTTVVNRDGEILGKPETIKEAISMILSLQGRPHRVLTGYSLLCVEKGELKSRSVNSVETKVFIQKMSPAEAKAYVARGESLDKAGGYAAQGVGMTIIEKIEGSYTNVVGLPISEVVKDLKKMGWKF